MSLLAQWQASPAASLAQRSFSASIFNTLTSLARHDSPAIADALEQQSLLPDDDELLNTLEIIAQMNPDLLSKESASEAERRAMWTPVSEADSRWNKSRKRKTSDFQKDLDDLNIQKLSVDQQVSRYRTWLTQNSRPAAPIRLVSSATARLGTIGTILRSPSTQLAKSTGGISTAVHPDLMSAAVALVGSADSAARTNQSNSSASKSSSPPGHRPTLAALSSSMKWRAVESLLVFTSENFPSSSKIAGFDMDHTLIEPKSGAKFPRDSNDWRWMFPQVKSALANLYNQGYNIVIFSNQAGVTKGKQNPQDLKKKIENMMSDLGVPLQAILATADDKYRKPSTAVWDFYVAKVNGAPVALSSSFYCGDAAGRSAHPPKRLKKDFSCSDRSFASNVGIPFHTESEFFLQEPPSPFSWDSPDPAQLLADMNTSLQAKSVPSMWHVASQEMIIFVGAPGSGKSTFARANLIPHGYVHINRDNLSTQAACMAAARKALESGKRVVVDNTSPARDGRAPYIQLAREFGIPVRCFRFRTDIALAKHLNMVREKTQGVQHIPEIGYNIFQSRLDEPSISEGFREVIDVPFVPRFETDAHKQAFLQRT
jgi:bifunctional polynucleotide phosphatase/kinase